MMRQSRQREGDRGASEGTIGGARDPGTVRSVRGGRVRGRVMDLINTIPEKGTDVTAGEARGLGREMFKTFHDKNYETLM